MKLCFVLIFIIDKRKRGLRAFENPSPESKPPLLSLSESSGQAPAWNSIKFLPGSQLAVMDPGAHCCLNFPSIETLIKCIDGTLFISDFYIYLHVILTLYFPQWMWLVYSSFRFRCIYSVLLNTINTSEKKAACPLKWLPKIVQLELKIGSRNRNIESVRLGANIG